MPSAPAQLEQLEKSLVRQQSGDVKFARYDRALYSTDASMYQIQPAGVVLPRTAEDVRVAVQLAAEFGVSIVARGGGTSLSGQSIGPGLVLDLSKYLARIVELDPVARVARVQPGVVLDQLNAAAAAHALQFGPDVATSSRANLGGMIGNNSAGSRSVLHGKMVDHVFELEMVLSDGQVVRLRPRSDAEVAALLPGKGAKDGALPPREAELWRAVLGLATTHADEIVARYPALVRRVSGYNLDEFVPACGERLLRPATAREARAAQRQHYGGAELNLARLGVGAEGTLGVVTEALVHLTPTPAARGIAVLEFDSLAAAIDVVNPALACGPSAVELFDKMILELAAESLEYRRYLDFVVGRPESLLLVEFSGTREEVEAALAALERQVGRHPGLSHYRSTCDRQFAEHIWACRKAALPLLMGIPGQRKPLAFVEDSAVDPRRLPEFVERFREILKRAGTQGAFYGHASVGVLHIRPLINTRDPEDVARLERILNEVAELVLEFGGAMSGEHGDGLARSYLIEKFFGRRLYQAFLELKQAFDPRGLMNPGKIVHGPPPTENLRHAPTEHLLEVQTTFDYSRQGGFQQAVALCNGAGLCRKTRSGTMCPSFMATGEEEHSTRGRANALRQVLSGTLPAEELTGERLYETFDLCLQCKGCKAECPSNVDVAKLKAEFLQQYYRVHGVPWGVRLMAHVETLNRLGAATAPWSNWLPRLPWARWLGERLLGIDRRRALPEFSRQNFLRWFRRRGAPGGRGALGPVVLLADCLTSYCEPGVNRAAVELLEAAGYEVHLAEVACCGRALISKGLLEEAQRLARENLARLQPWAQRGVPIVGCEPSCLLTLADDYRELVPGPAAEVVARQVVLAESLLAQGNVSFPLGNAPSADVTVLLHGHCHQKALVGVADTVKFLERVPGTRARVVDSGCCGMAGSFGYEHYELSQRIGERVLLPAVRAHGGPVVAPGFSCRHQIAEGTGRRALHPVEYVRGALASGSGIGPKTAT